jgi:hypothetical protein
MATFGAAKVVQASDHCISLLTSNPKLSNSDIPDILKDWAGTHGISGPELKLFLIEASAFVKAELGLRRLGKWARKMAGQSARVRPSGEGLPWYPVVSLERRESRRIRETTTTSSRKRVARTARRKKTRN